MYTYIYIGFPSQKKKKNNRKTKTEKKERNINKKQKARKNKRKKKTKKLNQKLTYLNIYTVCNTFTSMIDYTSSHKLSQLTLACFFMHIFYIIVFEIIYHVKSSANKKRKD